MIKMNLEIIDPRRSDGPQLLALAALFTQLAQGSTAEQTRAALDDKVMGERVVGMPQAVAAPYAGQTQLDPADNPAAGIPTAREAFADAGHAKPLPDPATVGFGAGNALAASGSASSPSPVSTGAASMSEPAASTTALPVPPAPGAAAAPVIPPPPGSVPNAPAVPSATPNGTPPAPSNGAQTAGASTPANVGVELDSEGVPWDASIHASTKTKTQDGKWKVKRGTGEAYLNERKAQLKAAVGAGNAAATTGAPAMPPPAALPPPVPAGAPVGNAPAAMPTMPQASPQTTPGTDGSNTVTMATLLPRVTKAISAGLLTADSAGAIVSELTGGQVQAVAMLAVAPAFIPQFSARLDALGIPQ
jgi:hypothetical protein